MLKSHLKLVEDFDFDPDDRSWAEERELVVPAEIEFFRNKRRKKGDLVLKSYAKNFTGKNFVELLEVFYNRDYRLTIRVNVG